MAISIKGSYFIWTMSAGYNVPYQRVVDLYKLDFESRRNTIWDDKSSNSRINEYGKYLFVISLACKSAARGQL